MCLEAVDGQEKCIFCHYWGYLFDLREKIVGYNFIYFFLGVYIHTLIFKLALIFLPI